jgi:transmembrane sensor
MEKPVASEGDDERRRHVADAADAWLDRLERTLKGNESAALREWLEVKAHRDAMLEQCKLWRGPEILAVLGELMVIDTLSSRVRRQYGRIVLAIFLAVSGLGLSTVLIAATRMWQGAEARANSLRAEAMYRAPVDERLEVKLPDGGTMLLNAAARALVSYGPHSRDVTLIRGEAGFDVIEDAARPFRLSAGPSRFEVSQGARFNVHRLTPDSAELIVIDGQVVALGSRSRTAMSPAQLRARLDHGEHAFSRSEGGMIGPGWYSARVLSSAELQQRLAWHRSPLKDP